MHVHTIAILSSTQRIITILAGHAVERKVTVARGKHVIAIVNILTLQQGEVQFWNPAHHFKILFEKPSRKIKVTPILTRVKFITPPIGVIVHDMSVCRIIAGKNVFSRSRVLGPVQCPRVNKRKFYDESRNRMNIGHGKPKTLVVPAFKLMVFK
jgi:hypothetical protein